MNDANQLSFICPGTPTEAHLWLLGGVHSWPGVGGDHNEPGYICLHLNDEWLDNSTFRRLSALGVECLAEGGPVLAYGIGKLDDELWDRLMEDPAVVAIEAGEPPSGK